MILIRSAKVVDGTGAAATIADVLVVGDRITGIGYFPNVHAEMIIDGGGYILAPGFIDIHSDLDHSLALFTDDGPTNLLCWGVTTVIGGNCGSSLAPLLSGELQSIQKWTDVTGVNVNWHTVAEFLAWLETRTLAINFATLVGHATIRRALLGEALRDLTDRELKIFVATLQQALADGAFGISTGLSYAHARQTPYDELKSLVSEVGVRGGVHAIHLRNEREHLTEAVAEALQLAAETKTRTVISHVRPLHGYEEYFNRSVTAIDPARADIFFDVCPHDASVVPLYQLLPLWAQRGGLRDMAQTLFNEHHAARIVRELPSVQRNDVLVVRAPGNDFLVDKTIGELAKNRGITSAEALLELMRMTRLRAVVLHRNVNRELLLKTALHPQAMISSNNNYWQESPFTTFLKYAETPLGSEKALHRMTGLPASVFGIADRGIIKVGAYADLVLLKNYKPILMMVNGQIVMRDGVVNGTRGGRVIRKI